MNDLALGRFDVYVFRNRKRHNQLFRFGVLLLETAQRDHGKNIHARTNKQPLVVFENSDNLIDASINTNGFPQRVSVRKQGLADRRAKDNDWPRVLLIEGADEAAARDAEERYRVNVLRFSSAHDDLFHAVVPAGYQIRIAEEKAACADSG